MGRNRKIGLMILLICFLVAVFAGCSNDPKITQIEIDQETFKDSYDISSFNVSDINIKLYYATESEDEEAVTEVIPLTLNMIKASDHVKLSVVGTHTITVTYRQVSMTFQLTLSRDIVGRHKVVFYAEDATTVLSTQYVTHGSSAETPEIPTKDKFSFAGWVDANGNTVTYDTVYDDIAAYATYKSIYCTVTFKAMDTTVISTVEIIKGESVAAYAPSIPAVAGYTAIGWNKSLDNITEDTDIFAEYTQDTINVFFKYGAEESEAKMYNYPAGERLSDAPVSPNFTNHEFLGWYTNKDYIGEPVTFPYMINSEMTFFAKYTSHTLGSEGLEYSGSQSNTCSVSGYTGNDSVIVIPRFHNGSEVVRVSASAFTGIDNVRFFVSSDNEYFSINNGVLFDKEKTVLYAYPSGKTETIYNVPSEVKIIKSYAFAEAKYLVELHWGNSESLTDIEDHAFNNCLKLSSFTVPKNTIKIGQYAFAMDEKNSLSSIIFEDDCDVEIIDKEAFAGLSMLTSIDLPDKSLNTLGDGVFNGCTQLIGIEIHVQNESFTTIDGVLFTKDESELIAFPANNNNILEAVYEIPDTVTTVRTYAFKDSNLMGVIVPASVTDLNRYALDSVKLKFVQFKSETERTSYYSDRPFGNNLPVIVVPSAAAYPNLVDQKYEVIEGSADRTYSYDDTTGYFYFRDLNNELTICGLIPPSTTGDVYRFMRSVIIPNKIDNYDVAYIDSYALYDNDLVESIVINEGVREIGDYAFSGLDALKSVTLPASLTKIMKGGFCNSFALDNIIIGNNSALEVVGDEVFVGTPWMENSTEEFLMLGSVLVKYNGYGLSAVLPDNVKVIAYSAFMDKGNLVKVQLNSALTRIDSFAFYGCSGLLYIDIPQSVTYIGESAFLYCDKLFMILMNSINPPELSYGKSGVFTTSTRYRYTSPQSADSSSEFIENGEINFKICVPNAAASRFFQEAAGWSEYSAYIKIIPGSANVTFTNGGQSTNYATNIIFEGDILTSTENEIFAGWVTRESDTANLSVEPVEFPYFLFGSDIHFYARWIESDVNVDNYGFEFRLINNDSEYAVSAYRGTSRYVIVPSYYKGKPVTKILSTAFSVQTSPDNAYVYNISIPSTLTDIEEYAFVDTKWYKEFRGDFVYINNILVSYKGVASNVVIPSHISSIIPGAFRNNDNIRSITFSQSVYTLPEQLMYGCRNLVEVIIPEGVGVIGSEAFKNCTKLADMTFPTTITKVSPTAFDGTPWLTNYSRDCVMINTVLYKYKGANDNRINQDTLHIPSVIMNDKGENVRVEKIEQQAFMNNIKLVKVYIPATVVSIGESAFEGCINIKYVQLASEIALRDIDNKAFYGCLALESFDMSDCTKLETIGSYAFANCGKLSSVSIPSSVSEMGESAFFESGIVSLSVGNGSRLTEIKSNAFKDCTNLLRIEIGASSALVIIGEAAFSGCVKLKSVTIPDSVLLSTIRSRAFYDCGELKNVVLPITLMTIGDDAFAKVPYMEVNTDTVTRVGSVLLRYTGSDSIVVISRDIAAISDNAFKGNTNIQEIIFESGSMLFSIGESAFEDCINLASITFPSSLVNVGRNAFTNTKWIEFASNDFVQINSILIRYKGKAKQAVIPASVNTVSYGAFSSADTLMNVVVPSSVKEIKLGAFDGLPSSCTVTMETTLPPTIDASEYISNKILVQDNAMLTTYSENSLWSAFTLATIEKYTITFDLGEDKPLYTGAELYYHGAPMRTLTIDTLYDELVPILNGYKFIGWYRTYNNAYEYYEDGAYNDPVSIPFTMTENVTFYAKWSNLDSGDSLASYAIMSIPGDVVDEAGYYITTYRSTSPITVVPSKFGTADIIGINKYESEVNGTVISYNGFANNENIEEVDFANETELKYIGEGVFANCINLRRIVLPYSLQRIAAGAFEGCVNLEEVSFADAPEGKSKEGIAVSIEENAFKNCSSIASIVLPDNLEFIGEHAFEGCTSLTSVTISKETPPSIPDTIPVFDEDTVDNLRIYVPESLILIYQATWTNYYSVIVKQ